MSVQGGEGEDGRRGFEADNPFDAEEQLTLSGDDDALPWLESDEDYEDEGTDYRILIFALAAVALLAAILAGGYFLLRDRGGSEMVPDGSTIEAPDEPYKSRPENPGGTQVSGTGDVSYEVGQGQTSEGQLADNAPAPSIDIDAQSTENASASDTAASASTSTSTVSGVGVQVGAYTSRETARAGWAQLRGRYSALQGLDYRIVEGTADSGTIYRLQAVASGGAAADSVCRSIRDAGGDCQVKR